MRVTIYQPRYFPQLHYFNRISDTDIFVLLDSAQYTKSLVHLVPGGKERRKSYQSDTPIKTSLGQYLLTVPIKHEGLLPINKTKIDYSRNWFSKHLAIIKSAYGKTKSFDTLFPQVQELLFKKYDTLANLNIATTIWGISYVLGFDLSINDFTLEKLNRRLLSAKNVRLKKVMIDKEINAQRPDGFRKGTEWTTAICKTLGANEYYHGGTAEASYMKPEYYKENGITPVIQNWQCKEYNQQFSKKIGFIPNLSTLDLLFNVDKKEAFNILLA